MGARAGASRGLDRPGRADPERARGLLYAALAVLFFSTSAVLVRLASGLGPLEVAAYRLLVGSGVVGFAAAVLRRRARGGRGAPHPAGEAPPSPRTGAEARLILAAGLAAAAHFALYIGSLYLRTIAHALVLVNLSPLLAAPLGALFLRERYGRDRLPGLVIALAGLGVMVGLEPRLDTRRLLGDLLAFGAALAYAVYSLLGRSQRGRGDVLAYTRRVYLVAGLTLLGPALWQRSLLLARGLLPGPGDLLAVVLLGLLPTAGGHTLYNAALRRADAVTVNLIATQEVTGGVLLGFLVLGERPSLQAVLGGALALLGLGLVLRRQPPSPSG
ncbi:MAG: DMT family transporter [Firmicutes bacterium]|nr:DMT family transporter [Bacillota bacterium]